MEKGKEHFDGIEPEYESMIVGIVPSYQDFFGSVLSFVPDGKIRILELGSGTGFVTSMLVAKNSSADITCIDLSPGMLAVAQNKPELSDVTFIAGDFREVWGNGTYDVVLTTLCLHHLPDNDRAGVLSAVYASLNDRGIFINGDVFLPDNEKEERLNLIWWRKAMMENGLPVDEADLMIQKRRNNAAYFDTISGYAEKLAVAGFQDSIVPYKNRMYSVSVAWK